MTTPQKNKRRGRPLRASKSMPLMMLNTNNTTLTDEEETTSNDGDVEFSPRKHRPLHNPAPVLLDPSPSRSRSGQACIFRSRLPTTHVVSPLQSADAAFDNTSTYSASPARKRVPRPSPPRRRSSFSTVSSDASAVSCIAKKDARWNIRRSVFVVLGVSALGWTIIMMHVLGRFHHGRSKDALGLTFWEARQQAGNVAVRGNLPPQTKDASSSFHGLALVPPPRAIPLPLPTQKVSVVLINYSRPRMIRESILMRTLLDHPSIDEVLMLHANPKTAFEFVHPKVVNIDATQHNDEMGLSLRFYFCQLAKNEWVIHVDDDMEFPTSALNELLVEFGRNPKRIVGKFGRDLKSSSFFNGYSSTSTHKHTEVVLTKLMVMEQEICPAFFEYAPLIWEDVILTSGEGPLWNGEDIFMSLVANHVYSNSVPSSISEDGTPSIARNNYAMDWLDVWQASDSLKDYQDGRLDISGGMKGYRLYSWSWWQSVVRRNRHYSYRGMLWQVARQRLADVNDATRVVLEATNE